MSSDSSGSLAEITSLYEQGRLSEATYRLLLSQLGASFDAQAGEGSAIAQGAGATSVAAGGVKAGNVQGSISTTVSIVNNRYEGPAPQDTAAARRIYLDVLSQAVSRLPMGAFDSSQANPNADQRELSLINVYTALDTTEQVRLTDEDTKKSKEHARIEGGDTRPLRALEAVAANRRLVLLGEPGSGKSSFAHFLICCLANSDTENGAVWMQSFNTDWPRRERDLLPVRVILRDFVAWAGSPACQCPHDTPRCLHDFISYTLAQQNLEFALPLIDDAIENGRAVIVLDGLDEATTLQQRGIARISIVVFAERHSNCRMLVTCRTWSYQPPDAGEPELRLTAFPIAQLAPFSEEKIDRFIAAWHAELVRTGKLDPARRDVLQPKLVRAVRQQDLRRLAGNPLQLTLMAWVHTDDGELPDKRARLYARAVDLLLWRWETQKAGAGGRSLRDLAGDVNGGDGQGKVERVLWRAAFEAHAQTTPQDQRKNPEKLADVSEAALKQAIARLKKDAQGKPDENWARDVVDAIKERSGLLAQRLPGSLTFPHRTFQEFLAGLWMVDQGLDEAGNAKAAQFEVWREVILLAVGNMAHNMKPPQLAAPILLVRRLCPVNGGDAEVDWRKVWLAGEALAEMGAAQAAERDGDTVRQVQTQLAYLVRTGQLSPRERAQAGDALARIGDPRFDPRWWYLPKEPLLGFVEVPAGPFYMGTRKQDFPALMKKLGIPENQHDIYEDEAWPDSEPLYLTRFFIACFPTTVAQFKAFVQDTDFKVGDTDCLRDEENRPVRWVSWHEAMTYCSWLTTKLRERDDTPEPLRTLLREQGWQVTLPSEAEWEKAARGPAPSRRIFPWGDDLPDNANNDYSNLAYTGIGTTSSVGIFPKGNNPDYGCLDMVGNVWEWTRSIYGPYPYQPGTDRENLHVRDNHIRVLRGGSWVLNQLFARCSYRGWYDPVDRYDVSGFRVVVRLAPVP